ncbi:hypothetical protein QR680_014824 [Steinernema hermaphroditum]|uniref:Uncharacterized protein n=1 Tax=Steinernema hermaphroditum TaxID=289476 RepID=A0AA39IA73_9BILA|nr:hypothetical protein QR680_014824 [Steinernema hermaphroditum]
MLEYLELDRICCECIYFPIRIRGQLRVSLLLALHETGFRAPGEALPSGELEGGDGLRGPRALQVLKVPRRRRGLLLGLFGIQWRHSTPRPLPTPDDAPAPLRSRRSEDSFLIDTPISECGTGSVGIGRLFEDATAPLPLTARPKVGPPPIPLATTCRVKLYEET